MWKFTQRSWVGGRLDAELRGRQDLAKYFQGASELVNFSVRRQGLLSKRRGTSLIAKLPKSTKAITNARIIPLVYEKHKGYALVFISYNKVNGSTVYRVSNEGIDEKGIEVPYSTDELDEFDYFQSGDTVFIAHRNHPPAKIVHKDNKITYEKIDFTNAQYNPPVIVGCTKDGVDNTKEGAIEASVYYVATYVKNGIESAPSAAFLMTYKTPWVSGGIASIKIRKGNNATEPDYYNLYKKDSSIYYGLIGNSTSARQCTLTPTISGATPIETSKTCFYYNGTKYGDDTSQCIYSGADTLNEKERDQYDYTITADTFDTDTEAFGKLNYYRIDSIGGMQVPSGSRLVLNFDHGTNTIVTRLTIGLGAFQVTNTITHGKEDSNICESILYLKDIFWDSYACFVTLNILNDKGNIVKTVTIEPSGEYPELAVDKRNDYENTGFSVVLWENPIDQMPSREHVNEKIAALNTAYKQIDRTAIIDFKDALNRYLKTNNLTGMPFEVAKIEVGCYDHLYSQKNTFFFNSIFFEDSYSTENAVDDSYITPDQSQTPPTNEKHFDETDNYPAHVSINQQRLIFASTNEDPAKYWMSCVGDLYNFNMHDAVREDDAIAAELAATEFPRINHIITSRDLIVFAECGEWLISPITGNSLTYKTISAKLQSSLGCSENIKPILVKDEIVFLNRTGDTLLAIRYNYASDGYESTDLSVLSQWITKNNPIKNIAYRQSPDSTIECILEDGSIATLVYMKEHEVIAWGRYILPNGYKYRSIACTQALSNGSSEMLYLVEKDGEWELWRERDDIPIRDETSGVDPTQHLCLDRLRELGTDEEPLDGEYSFTTADGKTYAGFPFTAILETMPPEPQGSDGTIQMEIKNAKDSEVRVLQSGDFTMRSVTVPDAYKVAGGVNATLTDGKLYLVSKDVRKLLAGRNGGDGRLHLESTTPFPLNILSLSIDYEIQPLSGSEG